VTTLVNLAPSSECYTPPSGDPGRYLLGGLGNQYPRYRDNDNDPFSSNTAHRGGGNPPDPYGDPWTENRMTEMITVDEEALNSKEILLNTSKGIETGLWIS
jgi:hypothetical protein